MPENVDIEIKDREGNKAIDHANESADQGIIYLLENAKINDSNLKFDQFLLL